MKVFISFLLALLSVLLSTQTLSQQLIPFQARLTNGTGSMVPDGVYAINFNIYDAATAGTALWTENHATVSVVGGVVNVILGSLTPLDDPNNDGNIIDAVTFFATDGDRYIGITIGAGQEMVPRHQLIPSFHAVAADNAEKLGGNLPSYYTSLSQHNTDIQAINTQFTGAIVAFSNSCPTGWLLADGTLGTPDLRGRFLRGESIGDPNSLEFGGNDDATIVSHLHSVNPPNTNTSAGGSHTHGIRRGLDNDTGNGSNGVPHWAQVGDRTPNWGFGTLTSNSAGNHSHAVNIGAFNSSSTGSSALNANIPRYYEVIYCVKQ